mmetsp:Transcript_7427/g.15930  ORF Transcript_7427/g.15930 Transcript_7427/m.15930 type:complete len:304 (-) Transcript_7427:7126-8037(-)
MWAPASTSDAVSPRTAYDHRAPTHLVRGGSSVPTTPLIPMRHLINRDGCLASRVGHFHPNSLPHALLACVARGSTSNRPGHTHCNERTLRELAILVEALGSTADSVPPGLGSGLLGVQPHNVVAFALNRDVGWGLQCVPPVGDNPLRTGAHEQVARILDIGVPLVHIAIAQIDSGDRPPPLIVDVARDLVLRHLGITLEDGNHSLAVPHPDCVRQSVILGVVFHPKLQSAIPVPQGARATAYPSEVGDLRPETHREITLQHGRHTATASAMVHNTVVPAGVADRSLVTEESVGIQIVGSGSPS